MSSFWQTAADIRNFNDAGLPCHDGSKYHDLDCGHRIREFYEGHCGTNCKKPKFSGVKITQYFICPICVTDEIRSYIKEVEAKIGNAAYTEQIMIEEYAPGIILQHVADGGKVVCSQVSKEENGFYQQLSDEFADAMEEERLKQAAKMHTRSVTQGRNQAVKKVMTDYQLHMQKMRRERLGAVRNKGPVTNCHPEGSRMETRKKAAARRAAEAVRSQADGFEDDDPTHATYSADVATDQKRPPKKQAPKPPPLERVRNSRVTRKSRTARSTRNTRKPTIRTSQASNQPPPNIPARSTDPVEMMRDMLEKVRIGEPIGELTRNMRRVHINHEIDGAGSSSENEADASDNEDNEDKPEDEFEDIGAREDSEDSDYDGGSDSDRDSDDEWLEGLEEEYDRKHGYDTRASAKIVFDYGQERMHEREETEKEDSDGDDETWEDVMP